MTSFAWTATKADADYEHYPPYVNITGNRLAVRGAERRGKGFVEPGEYAAVELPAEAMAELRAALGEPKQEQGE